MASKQHSSQIQLSRNGHGIRQYERIRKHEENEKTSEEENEICSEAEVTVTRRKARRFFKLGRSRPKTSSSRRRRISIPEMGRRLSGATLFSHLKVSWRRFTKALKNSRPHLAAVLGDSQLILNLHPPPPGYWQNHREGVKAQKP